MALLRTRSGVWLNLLFGLFAFITGVPGGDEVSREVESALSRLEVLDLVDFRILLSLEDLEPLEPIDEVRFRSVVKSAAFVYGFLLLKER